MKVLVHYSPSPCLEVFEGARLRKTIKALCEKAGIAWVDSPLSQPDIAHFISVRDEAKMRDLKEMGVKTVVSAFYCEHDPEARLLKAKEDGTVVLPKRSRRFLNAADLILVPSEKAKRLCIDNGLTPRVEVLRPSLFNYLYSEPESELNAGLRYFAIKPEDKVCVTLGSYKNLKGVKTLYEIAKRLPEVRFFFFGATRFRGSLSYSVACATAPENCRVFRLNSGDLFRSLLAHSSVYLITDPAPDFIGTAEAFASSAQVVLAGPNALNRLSDWEPLWVNCPTVDEAVAYLEKLYTGKANETIMPAAAYAKTISVSKQAANLASYYSSLLEGEKHD